MDDFKHRYLELISRWKEYDLLQAQSLFRLCQFLRQLVKFLDKPACAVSGAVTLMKYK